MVLILVSEIVRSRTSAFGPAATSCPTLGGAGRSGSAVVLSVSPGMVAEVAPDPVGGRSPSEPLVKMSTTSATRPATTSIVR